MKSLNGKIALVTGGSRGIGKAISLRLASEGAFVIVHYGSNKVEAEQTLKEIRQMGGEGVLVSADFKKSNAVENLFSQIDEVVVRDGEVHLDILVNNAGIGMIQDFETTTEAQLDALHAINIKSPFLVAQKACQRMKRGGRIINITSIVTRMASSSVGAYSMTKGAVDVLTLFLAKKLGPQQITVNSVAPGVINTEMNAEALGHPESRKFMESLSALGRVGEPQDIADVVAFVASEEARWISGQRIEASGGSFLGIS
ncbi:short-chain dehydrogenase [Bdellovibrio bacteriovorus]|uniref:Short-chain dehydrogenase n=1 Tax=Bdellovibrio bacteriovorus TaxID=959 RepID=A0A150WE29_BDEBC|nr:SDR family oxidoreductase [Bdellovibrio bacteriovorus]KYG61132.1 short-chain dehydrogenase [Bdellovibrio bacteriovorus]